MTKKSDVVARVEDAILMDTLPHSVNGTVRNISRAYAEAAGVDLSGEEYTRVKDAVRSWYDQHGTVEIAPSLGADIVLAIDTHRDAEPLSETVEIEVPEPVVEEPTVEGLTEALAMLGRTAVDAPEVLVDRLDEVLKRFRIETE